MAKSKEHLFQKIIECEKRGDFHLNVDEINMDGYNPVDESYHYLSRNLFEKVFFVCFRFIVMIAAFFINIFKFSLKIDGRKNLKGIKNAVIISNHVHYLDSMIIRQAVFGHRLYIVVGEFNNRKGLLGKLLRVSGTLPLSSSKRAMINFTKTTKLLLKNGNYLLMYPEEAEWHFYEKPRPFKDGAFHLAVKNHVPIIPVFITFKNKKRSKNKKAIVHILKPINFDNQLSEKDNIRILREKSFQSFQQKYEEFYKKPLIYETV